MKKIYLLLLTALIFTTGIGQVTTYTESEFTGTYVPITGGTVVDVATAPFDQAGGIVNKKYTLPSGTIPFNFRYDGSPYTGMDIFSNGFITFNGNVPAELVIPFNGNFGYSGAIIPFVTNLSALYNQNGNTGEIRYQTVGTAPNREFVIQFKNFQMAMSNTGGYFKVNFQIRLHENASIRFVYDVSKVGVPTNSYVQVGLRGPNAIINQSVNIRRVDTNYNTWAATIAGTTIQSQCALSANSTIPSGKTIVFSPPPLTCPNIVYPTPGQVNVPTL